MGRPTAYRAEYATQALALCELGATDAELASAFGVSTQTIGSWKSKFPLFLAALKAGKDVADDRVERSLYQRAVGYSYDAVKIMQDKGNPVIVPYREHMPPDTTAMIFWLKNRRKDQWRDRQELEHTGKDGGPVQVEVSAARERLAERVKTLAERTEQGDDSTE